MTSQDAPHDELRAAVKHLASVIRESLEAGMTLEEIAAELGLPIGEVERIRALA